MRKGWEEKCIADIATVKGGKRLPKGYTFENTATAYPYLTVSCFTDKGSISTSEVKYISERCYREISLYTISHNDLYISIAGTIGKSGFIPEVLDGANLTENACRLILHDGIEKKYLLYYTKSLKFVKDCSAKTRVTAQPKLSLERLKTIKVPLPNIYEQRRIVAILDDAFERIDKAIANTEKNIANAKDLFESFLNNAFENHSFDSKIVFVSEICESIVDCVNKTAPNVAVETSFKMIRTSNIKRGKVNLDNVKFVSEDVYKQWTRRQVPQIGDILLTREAPMGEVGMLLSDEKVFLGQRIVSYRADNSKVDNSFLYYALQTKNIQEQMSNVASGATVQHIRVPDTGKWRIQLPELAAQTMIVEKLNAANEIANKLEWKNTTKLASLRALKQSLLVAAFSGELTADFNPDALEL